MRMCAPEYLATSRNSPPKVYHVTLLLMREGGRDANHNGPRHGLRRSTMSGPGKRAESVNTNINLRDLAPFLDVSPILIKQYI